jgi:hypothetical protein
MGYAGERTGENQLGLAWDGAGFWPIAKQEQGNPSPIFKYFFHITNQYKFKLILTLARFLLTK